MVAKTKSAPQIKAWSQKMTPATAENYNPIVQFMVVIFTALSVVFLAVCLLNFGK